MTEKEKIRAGIIRRMKGQCPIVCSYIIYEDILNFIDSMQEEPTTSVWHNTRSEEPIVGRNIVMLYYNHIYSGEYLGERFFGCEKFTLMSDSKWAYIDDLMKL